MCYECAVHEHINMYVCVFYFVHIAKHTQRTCFILDMCVRVCTYGSRGEHVVLYYDLLLFVLLFLQSLIIGRQFDVLYVCVCVCVNAFVILFFFFFFLNYYCKRFLFLFNTRASCAHHHCYCCAIDAKSKELQT